jgi:hypothetical protein
MFDNGAINDVIHEVIVGMWDSICSYVYRNPKIISYYKIDKTSPDLIKELWKHFFRFYLKGGKATLRAVQEYISSGQGMKNKVAQIFFDELVRNTADSDWDFCAAVHPSFLENAEMMTFLHVFLKKQIEEACENIKVGLRNPLRYRHRVILKEINELINSIETQKTNLLPELRNSYRLNEETVNNSSIRSHLEMLIKSLEKSVPILFTINDIESLYVKVEKPEEDGIKETFNLYRALCKFEPYYDIEETRHPSLFPTKMFAECIDVSMSLNKEVNQDLFAKSSLDQMLQPIRNVTLASDVFYYPIAGLSYQLDDNIVILTELNPSKPLKRFQRFIQQIKMYCLRQNTPHLPQEINISRKMILNIRNDSNWKDFNTIFNTESLPTIKEIENDQSHLFYKLPIRAEFRELKRFEQWCVENNIEWFKIEDHKEDLYKLIIDLLEKNGYDDITSQDLAKFGKKELSKLLTELDLIFQCKSLVIFDYKQIIRSHPDKSYERIKADMSVFNVMLKRVITQYIKDLNMENKYNYSVVVKETLIETILTYEIEPTFKSLLKKFTERDI